MPIKKEKKIITVKKLCKCHASKESPSQSRWYPYLITTYDDLLENYIEDLEYRDLRKNISYNMQYLEYLHQVNIELSLSEVIIGQNYKSFIIFSVSVIECILHYWISKNNLQITKEWEKIFEKKIESGKIRGTINLESKLEMKLDGMIKVANSNSLLGEDKSIYKDLHKLRKLRNTTHMYNPKNQGTDWYIFGKAQYDLARSTLFKIFKILFKPNSKQEEIINFLKND